MKNLYIILLFTLLFLHSYSQENFYLRTSFDDVKVDQKETRLVANDSTSTSIFERYNNKRNGKISINYETRDLDAAIAQVEDAPRKKGKKALHFKIISPNVKEEGKKIKSRIQIELSKEPGFKSFVSEIYIYFPTSMKELNKYPYPITWLTLQEFWNAPVGNAGKTFRITIGMCKSRKGKLHFGYRSQDYKNGEFIDVAKSDDSSYEVPIGRWFKLKTEVIEGDNGSGFFCLSIKERRREKILYRFETQTMATAFCEKKYSPQGFTLIQPIKLYTSARLTEWMKERGCAIEAYFTDWTINGELYPHL